jgi:DNA mismatch repair protein MutL
MPDIIKLLPDSVANQIAAGEVIQRPSSAVKELLENAVDAGADNIQVLVKDAGKTLIQVIDNGCGMSVTDARMSFERHATSKINEAKDLFAIRTLGFRGEALASIAAISQLELKTKRLEDELGSCIRIEGSKVIDQSPCTTSAGTSIAVKNLFFNVPARRNFLKSNTSELRHITEEFLRIALVYTDIAFSLQTNNKVIYQLKKSGLKERIVAIYGNNYRERLVPLEQKSSISNLSGFIGKPEFARKTRGEQYFFVNGRFIKHPYLHHSVDNAFREILPADTYPSYFIYLETDPEKIDINIHPTKTEVNFQDQQHIYAILKSAVRQALGKFNVTPVIDFEVEQSIDFRPPGKDSPLKNPFDTPPSEYNPFDKSEVRPGKKPESEREKSNRENWGMLYDTGSLPSGRDEESIPSAPLFKPEEERNVASAIFQLAGRFIITRTTAGIMVIDQRRAHERVLYDRFLAQMESGTASSQQELFPQQLSFPHSDAEIIRDLKPDLELLGFNINELGKNTFVISGVPTDSVNKNIKELLDKLLDNYKKNLIDLNQDTRTNLARSMAINLAVKTGKPMGYEEMEALISSLFSSSMPETSPSGKKIIGMITEEELEKLLK